MQKRRNTVRRLGLLLALILFVVAASVAWHQASTPKTVLDYGKVTADSRFGNQGPITVRTRRVRRSGTISTEVELGPDTWLDCGGDCAETLRKQSIDFWETRRRREH